MSLRDVKAARMKTLKTLITLPATKRQTDSDDSSGSSDSDNSESSHLDEGPQPNMNHGQQNTVQPSKGEKNKNKFRNKLKHNLLGERNLLKLLCAHLKGQRVTPPDHLLTPLYLKKY